jgi:hypothetical protein
MPTAAELLYHTDTKLIIRHPASVAHDSGTDRLPAQQAMFALDFSARMA